MMPTEKEAHTMTTRASIATIAVGMVLAVIAAPAAQAGPGQMSPEAYQALQRRSLALNAIYGLGKPAKVTHAQYRASLVRGAALNERYGLPVALTSGEIERLYGTGRTKSPELAPPMSVPRGDAFDWSDAAIGAAFPAGLALIGVAGVAVGRRVLVPHLRH
jgi:hypothetical protein